MTFARIFVSALGIGVGATGVAVAQQSPLPEPVIRAYCADACDGRVISAASFINDGTDISVQCTAQNLGFDPTTLPECDDPAAPLFPGDGEIDPRLIGVLGVAGLIGGLGSGGGGGTDVADIVGGAAGGAGGQAGATTPDTQ